MADLFRIPGTHDKFVKLEIEQDEDAPNPRKEYDNVGTMVCFHGRYSFGDTDHGIRHEDFANWDEMEAYLYKEKNAAVVLPIYMYDHCGQAIRTSPFSCPESHGQLGFIYCTKEKAVYEWGKKLCTKKVIEKARKYLECEVREYNKYIQGDVHGYIVQACQLMEEDESLDELEEDEWEESAEAIGEEDSCWGLFGSEYAQYEGTQIVYSKMLDWMPPANIEEELRKSCDCNPERLDTEPRLQGPTGCLSCYLKKLVENYAKHLVDDPAAAALHCSSGTPNTPTRKC